MLGAIPPFQYVFMVWCLVKYRDNFTFVGKPKGKRQLGRRRCRWEDNIRIDLRKRELEVVDWMNLAQDKNQRWAVVNTVMNS
jgi:hypothetical protein